MKHSVAAVLLAFLVGACDQSFDPRGPFEARPVVYSILSNDRSQQYVRLYSTYNPPTLNPQDVTHDTQLTGALVQVEEGAVVIPFRDTSLARPDTSRYRDSLHLYLAAPFIPQPGKTYRLSIRVAPFGRITATVTLPSSASLSLTSGYSTVTSPGTSDPNRLISVVTTFSSITKGFVLRMLVEYEVEQNSTIRVEQVEVPTTFRQSGFDLASAVYPSLSRVLARGSRIDFLVGAYRAVLNHLILERYPASPITFRRVVFQLVQVEPALYDYYSITNGFQDPFSIRLDQPLRTNIEGGYGVFGGYTLDSLVFSLPAQFEYNRR